MDKDDNAATSETEQKFEPLILDQANAQSKKQVVSKTFAIVNSVEYSDSKGFPLLNFTFKNYMDSSIIINRVQLQLINFKTNGITSIPKTEELKPVAYWDLDIPLDKGLYTYKPKFPIQISSKDAATVQLRIFRGWEKKALTPQQCGLFTFKLFFLTTDNMKVASDTLYVGQ